MNGVALRVAMMVTGIDIPGMEKTPTPDTQHGATNPGYIEFLEQNSHIIYPALGVLVVIVLAIGILQAWRSQDLDGLAKAEFKREVILEIRKQIGGVTAEALSRALGLETFKMLRLLEEMQADGLLQSHTNTSRLTVWRLKGVGDGTHGISAPKKKKRVARG